MSLSMSKNGRGHDYRNGYYQPFKGTEDTSEKWIVAFAVLLTIFIVAFLVCFVLFGIYLYRRHAKRGGAKPDPEQAQAKTKVTGVKGREATKTPSTDKYQTKMEGKEDRRKKKREAKNTSHPSPSTATASGRSTSTASTSATPDSLGASKKTLKSSLKTENAKSSVDTAATPVVSSASAPSGSEVKEIPIVENKPVDAGPTSSVSAPASTQPALTAKVEGDEALDRMAPWITVESAEFENGKRGTKITMVTKEVTAEKAK